MEPSTYNIVKRIVSILVIVCYLVQPATGYGYTRPALFKSKSHAQRYLKDEKEGILNALKNPSIVDISKQYGNVVDWHKAEDNDRLIIHIQDRHVDEVAQLNIASIIDELIQKYGIYMLSLEGASKELDTSFYDKFPDGEIKKKVARFFVKKALFAGSEYYKITHQDKYLRALGAEDKGLYLKHLDSYKKNQLDKNKVLPLVRAIKKALNNIKTRAYSRQLKKLDTNSQSYKNKKTNLAEYIQAIVGAASRPRMTVRRQEAAPTLGDQYPNVTAFLQLAQAEKQIDFARAREQRDDLIKYLSGTLEKKQVKELLKKSLEFKLSKITDKEFYTYLKSVIANNAVVGAPKFRGEHSSLFAYIDYLDQSTKIDYLKLFNEVEDLEEETKKALCKNDTQRKLVQYSKAADYLEELYKLQLTNEKLTYINSHAEAFNIKNIQNFIKHTSARYSLNVNSTILNAYISQKAFNDSIKFYKLALRRDIALVENTLSNMKKLRKDKAILITGGFHTSGITHFLKEKGISYVVICPNLGEQDCEELYADRIAGKIPDIEKLTELFKQTLAVPLATAGAEAAGAARKIFAALIAAAKLQRKGSTDGAPKEMAEMPLFEGKSVRLIPHKTYTIPSSATVYITLGPDSPPKDKRDARRGDVRKGIVTIVIKKAVDGKYYFTKEDPNNPVLAKLPAKSVLGRGDMTGVIREELDGWNNLSREHIEITIDGDKIKIKDLGSLNKTAVGIRTSTEKTGLVSINPHFVLNRGTGRYELSPHSAVIGSHGIPEKDAGWIQLLFDKAAVAGKRGMKAAAERLESLAKEELRVALGESGEQGAKEDDDELAEVDPIEKTTPFPQYYISPNNPFWKYWAEHSVPEDQMQGWKLHVAATPENIEGILKIVLPILQQHEVPHKVVNGLGNLRHLNRTEEGNTQIGKAVAIYSRSKEQAEILARELDLALRDKNFRAPAGLKWNKRGSEGDKLVKGGKSGLVGYRYGSFRGAHVVLPNGEVVDDERGKYKPSGFYDSMQNMSFMSKLSQGVEGAAEAIEAHPSAIDGISRDEEDTYNKIIASLDENEKKLMIVMLLAFGKQDQARPLLKSPASLTSMNIVLTPEMVAAFLYLREDIAKLIKESSPLPESGQSLTPLMQKTSGMDEQIRLAKQAHPSKQNELLAQVLTEHIFTPPARLIQLNIELQDPDIIRLIYAITLALEDADEARNVLTDNAVPFITPEIASQYLLAKDVYDKAGELKQRRGTLFWAVRTALMDRLKESTSDYERYFGGTLESAMNKLKILGGHDVLEAIANYEEDVSSFGHLNIGKAPPDGDLGAQFGGDLKFIGELLLRAKAFYAVGKGWQAARKAAPHQMVNYFIGHINPTPLSQELQQKVLETLPTELKPQVDVRVLLIDLPEDKHGKSFKRDIIGQEGGISAINFHNPVTGTWDVIILREDFQQYKDAKGMPTLKHELAEVALRQQGQHWVQAHNRAVKELGIGGEIDEAKAKESASGVQDEIGAATSGPSHTIVLTKTPTTLKKDQPYIATEFPIAMTLVLKTKPGYPSVELRIDMEGDRLWVKRKNDPEVRIEVKGELTIGRRTKGMEAFGFHDAVSGEHVLVKKSGKAVIITDYSSNGTSAHILEESAPTDESEVDIEHVNKHPTYKFDSEGKFVEVETTLSPTQFINLVRVPKEYKSKLQEMFNEAAKERAKGKDEQARGHNEKAEDLQDLAQAALDMVILATTDDLDKIKSSIESFLAKMNQFYPAPHSGIVELDPDLPTLVIPDVHARRTELIDLLLNVGKDGKTYLEKHVFGELQIIMLGDLRDSENPDLWGKIQEESVHEDCTLFSGPMETPNADGEMANSFGVAAMAMLLKQNFPKHFHVLKGDHENVADTTEHGNDHYSKGFRGMIPQSTAIMEWVSNRFGKEFLNKFAEWENSLPILVKGGSFNASHTDPGKPFTKAELQERGDDAVGSMTWPDRWHKKHEEGRDRELYIRPLLQEMHGHWKGKFHIISHTQPKTHTSVGVKLIEEDRLLVVNDPNRLIGVFVEPGDTFNYTVVGLDEEPPSTPSDDSLGAQLNGNLALMNELVRRAKIFYIAGEGWQKAKKTTSEQMVDYFIRHIHSPPPDVDLKGASIQDLDELDPNLQQEVLKTLPPDLKPQDEVRVLLIDLPKDAHGRSFKRDVVGQEGGVGAINFHNLANGTWDVIIPRENFEEQNKEKGISNLSHELAEVTLRQKGWNWVDAHNSVVRRLHIGRPILKAQGQIGAAMSAPPTETKTPKTDYGPVIMVLGRPGSGKDLVSEIIAEELGLAKAHFSPGALIRKYGTGIPIAELIKREAAERGVDITKGLVIDKPPQSHSAEDPGEISELEALGISLNGLVVVHVDTDEAIARKRASGREKRGDDAEIDKRMEKFTQFSLPAIQRFSEQGIVFIIENNGDIYFKTDEEFKEKLRALVKPKITEMQRFIASRGVKQDTARQRIIETIKMHGDRYAEINDQVEAIIDEYKTGTPLSDDHIATLKRLFSMAEYAHSAVMLHRRVAQDKVIMTFNGTGKKILNTEFSEKVNDGISDTAKRVLFALLKEYGFTTTDSENGHINELLFQGFYKSTFAFGKEVLNRIDDLNKIFLQLSTIMTGFIRGDTDRIRIGEEEIILELDKKLPDFSFSVYFGLSEPVELADSKDDDPRLLALLHAEQAAKIARRENESGNNDRFGGRFSQETFDALMERAHGINGLRQQLEEKGLIVSETGMPNEDLMQQVRGIPEIKLKELGEDNALYLIKQYLDIINLLDYAKNWRNSSRTQDTERIVDILDRLQHTINGRAPPEKENIEELINDTLSIIRINPKHPKLQLVSEEAFNYHAPVLASEGGWVVSMDVEGFWASLQKGLSEALGQYMAASDADKQKVLLDEILNGDDNIKETISNTIAKLIDEVFGNAVPMVNITPDGSRKARLISQKGGDEIIFYVKKRFDMKELAQKLGELDLKVRVMAAEMNYADKGPGTSFGLNLTDVARGAFDEHYLTAGRETLLGDGYVSTAELEKLAKRIKAKGIDNTVITKENIGTKREPVSAWFILHGSEKMPADEFLQEHGIEIPEVSRVGAGIGAMLGSVGDSEGVVSPLINGLSELDNLVKEKAVDKHSMDEYILMVDAAALLDARGKLRAEAVDLLRKLADVPTYLKRSKKFHVLIKTDGKNERAINKSGVLNFANVRLLSEYLKTEFDMDNSAIKQAMSQNNYDTQLEAEIEIIIENRRRKIGKDAPIGILAGPKEQVDLISNAIEKRNRESGKNRGAYIVSQEGIVLFEAVLANVLPKLFKHDPKDFLQKILEILPPISHSQAVRLLEAIEKTLEVITSQA